MVRILIGIPTAKYIESETFMSIYRMKKPDDVQLDLQCFYGYNIAQIRNLMAHYTIECGYDYMFWADSDLVFPEDTLLKLYALQRDIATGVYIQRKHEKKIPEIYIPTNKNGMINLPIEELYKHEGKILQAVGCGFGCVLTSVKVLKDVGYPQFEYFNAIDHRDTISEDVDFCRKAVEKGYMVYVDTTVKCEHIGSTKFVI